MHWPSKHTLENLVPVHCTSFKHNVPTVKFSEKENNVLIKKVKYIHVQLQYIRIDIDFGIDTFPK